jgi:PAS domain S-box-containing protein
LIMRKTFVVQIISLLVLTTIVACIGIPIVKAQAGPSNKIELTTEERQWLEEHKENIRYAPSPGYPPIGFVENGEYKGVTADFLRVIEKRLNIRFDMVYSETWNELMDKARAGKVDMVGNIQNTPERRKFLRFSSPYIRIPNSIIVKKDFKGSLSLSQMDGMKVTIVKGYSSLAYVKTKYSGMIIVPVRDNPTGLQMVSFGRADAMITDLAVASYFIERLGISNLRVAGSIDYVWNLCFAFRKDWPQLNTLLNKALNTISESQRQEITNRWIHLMPRGWQPRPQFWIALAGVIVVLLIIGILVWILTLRRRVQARTIDLQTELAQRKQAEKALLESEDLYRTIAESSRVGFWHVDRDGFTIYLNPAMCSILEIKNPEELAGKTYHLFFTPESLEVVRREHAKRPEGVASSYEVEIVGQRGGRRNVVISGAPLFSADGQLQSLIGTFTDISERKRAENALQDSHAKLEERVKMRTAELVKANEKLRGEIQERKRAEQALIDSQKLYRDLWDNAPAAYHVVDTRGIVLQVNQTEAAMLGYTKEEIVGKPIFDFILPEQRKDAEKRFELKLEGKSIAKQIDRIYVKKDGSKIYVSIDDRLEYDSVGKLLGVRTTMVDVSERKKAEKALRRVNRALKVLSDCNEAVVYATEESEFVKEVCRIIVQDGGYRLAWVGFKEQDDTKTVRPVGQWGFEDGYLDTVNITWADTERGRGPTGTAIRTKKPSIARDIMTEPRFAPWRPAAIKRGYASSISLPLIADGQSIGALNIYAKEPGAFDTEEVDLLSNLADDLSYGIMALRAKAELEWLSSRLLEVQEDERKRLSRELHDSTGQLLAALKFGIENALDRMHHGTIKESIELLEAVIPLAQQASDEVRRIHTDLRPLMIDDLGIVATISWFCREFETLYAGVRIEQMILMDQKRVPEPLKIVIFRILQEALNNVAKYSKADRVRVALREKDDKLELAIEDNGQGFDVEHVRSEKNADRGVGLTSMKERTELSGGSFSIHSSKGKGTTVRASWVKE